MTFGSKMSHPSKTRISALEKLKQSNAAKLELETRKMEDRIRSLKEKMMKEKEERERLGGSRWTSGRTGPLTKNVQKSQVSKKNHTTGAVNKVPRKIKVLTDEPADKYIRKPRLIPVSENLVNLCGQCEKNASAWHCHECSEKYCSACFDQFHLKGALRKHTKTRVGDVAPEEAKSPATARQENLLLRSNGTTTNASPMRNYMNGPSLLNGSYDEEESANSFAQALQEWRNQNNGAKITARNQPVCSDISCGTSNASINDQEDKKELTIKFNSSISYGDRLYLKKNRENPLEPLALTRKINECEKNVRRDAKDNDVCKNDTRFGFEHEEKDNETADHFAPNYREMIQNITAVKPEPYISSLFQQDNSPSQRAISVDEVSPVELNTQDDQGTTCIIEECEEAVSDQTRPSSRHGAVTICELYSSRDYEQNLAEDLNQSTADTFDTNNYVSPSITSKPFFLKPTGKVKTTNQRIRTVSAGGRKPSKKDEQRKTSVSREQQSPKHSSKKRQHDKEFPLHKGIDVYESSSNQRSNSNKQTPLIKDKGKEKETLSNRSHCSPRPSQNEAPAKNETRIQIRKAWKPKPTHKELSGFFLAGVDEPVENLQYEGVYSERSSSPQIINLGRGCLSSTWNPVESYPQVSPDSIDIPPCIERGTSTPETQHYQTSTFEERYSGTVTEIDSNSDDFQLISHKFEELEELPVTGVFKDTAKSNSSNEEELLGLTALDDFGTWNQDDDDLATLNDLAWELESSTGRLTRCEEDFHIDSDNDSIEDRDDGSGLTTPATLSRSAKFRESIMDDFEEMERKFMEEEF